MAKTIQCDSKLSSFLVCLLSACIVSYSDAVNYNLLESSFVSWAFERNGCFQCSCAFKSARTTHQFYVR